MSEAILIQKQPNNHQNSKIRVINKLETDYNLVIKFHWVNQVTQYAGGKSYWGKPVEYPSKTKCRYNIPS